MTDLFVDLPMRRSPDLLDGPAEARRHFYRERRWIQTQYAHAYYGQEGELSASYFIRKMSHSKLKRIVLEGAPGQGKSTVTQYVCQVMRMQLLDMTEAVNALPKIHKHAQVRIPLRVDLRDLAKWLSGVDPFQSKLIQLEEKEIRSLEGLLAAQVRHSSGGHAFNVSDLTAIAKVSHIFIALDGFDEVADVELRKRLVDEISKGINRLANAGGYSVQTVVTSRPVAFAKSIRFPREQWDYFELLPLERGQVDEYTSKWMTAKGLKENEKNQLRRLLDTKLKEAHTQYLAKNPMQLTILLSLIHNRGASLPEKRTAMYDAYMDMFFSRESEKSDIVRDNRDVLIDIHRFLAWKLQTSAEAGGNGSIEYNELRSTLFSYLDREEEDTTIVDALFNGIIERVGALVSRVQDTYEFEVQPLREYFVARYLYETSPYPSGEGEEKGDKFDRFKALIRNPYWLNVTRFYGGCFNKGEILTLVNELVELAKGQPYDCTSHVRAIALMLLGDWVFTQYQPGVKSVVNFITDYPQLRQLLASVEQPSTELWSVLPERSGRADFIAVLIGHIVKTKHFDERSALAKIINQNTTSSERFVHWQQAQSLMPHLEWTKLGIALNVYATASNEQAVALLASNSEAILDRFVESQCFEMLESSQYADKARTLLLRDVCFFYSGFEEGSPNKLRWLALICSTHQYGLVFEYSGMTGVSWRHFLEGRISRGHFLPKSATPETLKTDEFAEDERNAIAAYLAFLEVNAEVLSISVAPWSDLVAALRRTWGDCSAFDRIAFLSAGIRSKVDLGDDGDLGSNDNIVDTARFARLKSGAPHWWRERLSQNIEPAARVRWLLLLWLWATPRTLVKLAEFLDRLLSDLSKRDWMHLCREFFILSTFVRKTDDTYAIAAHELSQFGAASPRVCSFIGQRLPLKLQSKLATVIAQNSSAEAPEIQFALESTIRTAAGEASWGGSLEMIKDLYLRGAHIPAGIRRNFEIPSDVAKIVSRQPENLPLPLIAAADEVLRAEAGSNAEGLQTIASRDKWFR